MYVQSSGNTLRQKQIWTLVSADDGTVHLKSYLGKYLYGDRDGNVKADAEAPSATTKWTIQPQPNGTWALISAANYYFHGTGTDISAFLEAKPGVAAPSDGLWVVHLAMHPQINLYNAMRKRYLHLSGEQLVCDEDIPWGDDALLNLIFFGDHPDGRYGIQACDGRFVENTGKLVDQANSNCQFLLGFHDNQVSFMDSNGSEFFLGGRSNCSLQQKTKKQKTRTVIFLCIFNLFRVFVLFLANFYYYFILFFEQNFCHVTGDLLLQKHTRTRLAVMSSSLFRIHNPSLSLQTTVASSYLYVMALKLKPTKRM